MFPRSDKDGAELNDLDENYFVLLGGQDGWIGSENFLDQVPLWKSGEYMQLPLSTEGVRERFPWTTEVAAKRASSESLKTE